MGLLNEGFAQGRSLVVDANWNLNGDSSFDETIALQVAQRSRQGLLAHTLDTIHQPRETQRTVPRKLAQRPKRPLVRGAGDDFANDGLLRIAECAAKRNFI
jgi:hypothetical protein